MSDYNKLRCFALALVLLPALLWAILGYGVASVDRVIIVAVIVYCTAIIVNKLDHLIEQLKGPKV